MHGGRVLLTTKLKEELSKRALNKQIKVSCFLMVLWFLAVAAFGHWTLEASVKIKAISLTADFKRNLEENLPQFSQELLRLEGRKRNKDEAQESVDVRQKELLKNLNSIAESIGSTIEQSCPSAVEESASTATELLTQLGEELRTGKQALIKEPFVKNPKLNKRMLLFVAYALGSGSPELKTIIRDTQEQLLNVEAWYHPHWSIPTSFIFGYLSPLRDSIAIRMLEIDSPGRPTGKLLPVQLILDDTYIELVSDRNMLADKGKGVMDAIATKLEPSGLWDMSVAVTMSLLLGIFQVATLAYLALALGPLIRQRNEISLQKCLIPNDLGVADSDDAWLNRLADASDIDGDDMVQALTYNDFSERTPAFTHPFWSNGGASRFEMRMRESSTLNKGILVPRIFSDFFSRAKTQSASLTSPTVLVSFIERSRDAIDRKISDSEKSIDSEIHSYISIVETIGFIGTLLGIVIAFGAIPAMQLPTNNILSRAATMSMVTSGLVLAFSTTFVAQSAKLFLVILHRSRRREMEELSEHFIQFVEDFVTIRGQ
jgi:biopolymer transport protein ExbB/TolQ